jgi:hypothetical protein
MELTMETEAAHHRRHGHVVQIVRESLLQRAALVLAASVVLAFVAVIMKSSGLPDRLITWILGG